MTCAAQLQAGRPASFDLTRADLRYTTVYKSINSDGFRVFVQLCWAYQKVWLGVWNLDVTNLLAVEQPLRVSPSFSRLIVSFAFFFQSIIVDQYKSIFS